MAKKNNSVLFIFVLLGMLTAFAPFVTDMYLPSLPMMTEYFDTTIPMVQMGLTFSMLGLAAGQLAFGPLSDAYGRRGILLISLILFIIATLACIWAPNITVFVALRFVQGIAASGGIVISRSIATDKFKRKNLAKALAIVGAINGIAPVTAPVIGGIALKIMSWRGIFVILLILGLILLAASLNFKESLSHQRRKKLNISELAAMFKTVLQNKTYLYYTLELSLALAIMFAYIASSPFVIQQHYGMSPLAFSLLFAANALAIGIGSGVSIKFKSPRFCLKVSCTGMLICALLSLIMILPGISIIIYEAILLVLCFMMGLTFTVATTLAMDSARKAAGTASALLGATGFLFGSIVSPLAGMGNILQSTAIIMIVCALGAFWCVYKAGTVKTTKNVRSK